MQLAAADGQSLSLTIEGYQFPEETTADYDSNWLVVSVMVSHPRGAWQASDAALLTYEVARLADWLDAAAKIDELLEPEEFTEPNLAFHVAQGPRGRVLRVLFGLELRPTWAASDVASTGEVALEFRITEVDLHAAARDLRAQLQRYPQRASR